MIVAAERIPVQALVERYGSPLYVYELERVREAHQALARALPESSIIFYSLKANPHPSIVQVLHNNGCHAEISSVGELDQAVEAGVPPSHCFYTGPGKTVKEIEYAIGKGVTHFSVDSFHDIRKVAAIASELKTPVKLALRINPDEPVPDLSLTMTGVPSQFGFDASALLNQEHAWDFGPWVRIAGFHLYMGTNLKTTESLLHMYEKTVDLAQQLAAALNIQLEWLDLGGGFGQPFIQEGDRHDFSKLREPLEKLLDDRFPDWRVGKPQIAFESGRYLVGGAGTLFTTVQDVKISKDQTFIILDTGIHHLGGMSGLGRLTRITTDFIKVGDSKAEPSETLQAHVVGPLCTPLDYLSRNAEVPDVRPGDILAVPNAGAYGLTASLIAFLSRETPRELTIGEDGTIHCSQLHLTRREEEMG